jgi:hypothetical protein
MRKLTSWAISAALIVAGPIQSEAWAWGASGHSIVGELAQRRLNARARAGVEALLGRGASLASVASWADDVREQRGYSYNWHFVSIPNAEASYDPVRDCRAQGGGDCIVAELERLQREIRCADTDAERLDALRYAVHFVGDLHQPLHAFMEARGGNDVEVTFDVRGVICRTPCPTTSNLHSVWDTGLIEKSVWNWGAYVDRIESGWMRTEEAQRAPGGSVRDWANASHAAAQTIWAMTPEDRVLNDGYWRTAQLTLDRQLGAGGIHLAEYLNDAFAVRCEGNRLLAWFDR